MHGLYKGIGKGAMTPLARDHGFIVPVDTEALRAQKKQKPPRVKFQVPGRTELAGKRRLKLKTLDEDAIFEELEAKLERQGLK